MEGVCVVWLVFSCMMTIRLSASQITKTITRTTDKVLARVSQELISETQSWLRIIKGPEHSLKTLPGRQEMVMFYVLDK